MNNRIDNFDFQRLLNEQDKRVQNYPTGLTEKKASGRLKATRGATMYDFISMVAEVVKRTMPEVEFIPDEGAIIKDPSKALEKTVILYQITSREPTQELKARYAESIVEETDKETGEKRFGHVWIQRQNCYVQFNIIASNWQNAEKAVNKFEDIMQNYSGYYKSNGVAEILFNRYFTDLSYDNYRQWLSVRTIEYFVMIEKIIPMYSLLIGDINIEK